MNQETKKLKIYFTSDVHGYFYPTSYGDRFEKPMGLFACADGFHKDENTLLIDGGDMLQGSAFAYYCSQILNSPEKIAEILNDCGYDYYTIGNHDFNYGMKYQAAYRNAHQGRCICQNITDENGKTLYPYDIRVMPDGLRVGIVGIVTDYVNIWEREENIAGVKITDPFEAAKQALSELKDKTDLTVCVYHGGFERDVKTGNVLSTTTENVGYRICEELDFDLLLTGHQHMSFDGQYCHGTYVVQPVENAREYHYLEIAVTDGKKEIISRRIPAGTALEEVQPENAELSGQTDNLLRNEGAKTSAGFGKFLRKKYQPMEDRIQQWLDQPIGHLSRALLPEEKVNMALHGSPIADFLNKVQFYFSNAQLSSVGLANEIAGFRKDVSVRDIIATYPYPNTLIVCRINGKQLREAMERSAEYFAVDEAGNIQVAESFLVPKIEHYNYDYYKGVTYEIAPENPIGSRIKNLCYEGKEVTDTDSFTLCLNNYRYSGAGGYDVYRECETVKEINIEMVELIMEYFRKNPYVEV